MMCARSPELCNAPLDLQVRHQIILINTLDLQMVNLSLRVLYKPRPDMIHEVYRFLGEDYDGRVLPSIVNEVLKAVVAKYTAQSMLTKREEVSRRIREDLDLRLRDFYIMLEDVSITDLHFGAEFTKAIEEK
jgi:regulator of protease activity HflC (stomatin/prohibitin superfamily)